MSLISFSSIVDGTTATASQVNTPLSTIYNDYNGNITNANIASNAAIEGSKVSIASQSNPYKFSVYLSGNKTVSASTWTKVAFDTESFDTGSNFSTSTNQFTAPVAGFYFFEVSICGDGVATTGSLSAGINVNTFSSFPTYQGASAIPGATGNPIVHFSRLIQLSANDTVQFYVFTSTTQLIPGNVPPKLTAASGFFISAT